MPATAAIVLVHGALADASCGPRALMLSPGGAQRWALSTAIRNASEDRERQPESGRVDWLRVPLPIFDWVHQLNMESD